MSSRRDFLFYVTAFALAEDKAYDEAGGRNAMRAPALFASQRNEVHSTIVPSKSGGAADLPTAPRYARLDFYSNGRDGKLYANGVPFAVKVCQTLLDN